ncbi:MAG: penicillin acylase family protein [Pseudomonadota bacterium]
MTRLAATASTLIWLMLAGASPQAAAVPAPQPAIAAAASAAAAPDPAASPSPEPAAAPPASAVPVIPRDEPYRYQVSGLEQPARIRVDTWGVPHIEAQTHYDAFFVQGFNAARDRLWQIDLWRRRGLGELSTVFGPDYLAQDRAARLFLYRGDMYREWLAYGSDAKAIASAFTAGINAYIALTEADPGLLPPEFGLLGYRPARWSASDTVRIRSHGLWRNVVREVRRARIWCELGEDATRVWKVLEPTWRTRVPPGLDPCDIPEDVLETYLLAKAPVALSAEPRLPSQSARQRLKQAAQSNIQLGSNNWAVAPERSSTGRPVLADDPHRGYAVPSLRYIAHLKAPGLDVIGAGEPALPGISIGHNERIGFGLTIFPIDQEDLYVYVKQRGGYYYQGQAERLTLVEETLTLPDGSEETLTLRFTRHGPVVHESDKFLFAVRAAWLEPGMAPYFGSIEYMRAQNWRTFVAALNRWGAPSENQVYADIDGNIGYKPAGLFPRRSGWDGLLPVPGDGRYEWDGFFDMDVLPEEYNPERGFVSSANGMNLPPDYDIERFPLGFEWAAPWRQGRLREALSQQSKHGLEAAAALQWDYRSLYALRLLEALRNRFPDVDQPAVIEASTEPSPNEASTSSSSDGAANASASASEAESSTRTAAATSDTKRALDLLLAWDAELEVDSAAAALYMLWLYEHLDTAVARWLTGLDDPSLIQPLDRYTLLAFLREPEATSVLEETLAAAWQTASKRLGSDSKQWRWGDLHQIRFQHPLLAEQQRALEEPNAMASAEVYERFALPSYPLGGNSHTTNRASFFNNSYDVTLGASFRMVLDVGNWDAATMTNAPGQSGDPRSPYYGNLLEGWATEQSFPLLYSDDAVAERTTLTIELTPQP